MKPAETAASNALPPRSSTPMATWEAIQCVDATTPNVPRISGRVVNGSIGEVCRTGRGRERTPDIDRWVFANQGLAIGTQGAMDSPT
jgi:hypothetical protein